MKFPLHPRPFLPVELTREQRDAHTHTAMAVLTETIAEYQFYVHKKNRVMNKKRWKAVKTRENVTVYKKRDLEDVAMLTTGGSAASGGSRPAARSTASSSSHSSATSGGAVSASAIMDWSLPKLLGVGTIVGSLEDVMYGVISPDEDCIKVKSTYCDDEIVDGQVLHEIKRATNDDPFQFLGLKWFVKAHPASINAVVWPRDLVFIEGTGVHEMPNGERFGYHLMHSVDVPECHALTSMGITRGTFSTCLLFKQLGNGTVELYMKSFVEPAGSLPDSLAIMSAANGLIGCWKSVWCAQNKKLAWLLQDAARKRSGKQDAVRIRTNAQGKQCCSMCEHSLSAFRSAVVCELCRAVVCSKCKTGRKITYVHHHGEPKKIPTVFCKNCITVANTTSSTMVARHEYVLGETANRWEPAPSDASNALTESLGGHPSDNAWEVDSVSDIDTISDWENRHPMPAEYMRPSVAYGYDAPPLLEAMTPRRQNQVIMPAPPPVVDPQQQLWMQMNQLRVQAEQAYLTTRSNNRVMHETLKRNPS